MPAKKAAAETMRITPKDLPSPEAHLHVEGKRCQMGYAIECDAEIAQQLIDKDIAYAAPEGMEDFFDEQAARLTQSPGQILTASDV